MPILETSPLPSFITASQAKAERDALINAKFSRAKFAVACSRASRHRLHEYFNFATQAEFVRDCFPGSGRGLTAFREAARIGNWLYFAAQKLPELRGDPARVEKYAARKLDELHRAVEQQSSYIGELARTNIIAGSVAQVNRNVAEVRILHEQSKDCRDFKKLVREAFGSSNPGRVEGAAKRPRTVRVIARFTPDEFAWVAADLTGLALVAGINKNFDELDAHELGRLLCLMLKRHKSLSASSKSEDVDDTEH